MENQQIVIDATDAVLGRLASFIAKEALLGKRVAVINSENAIIKGNKENILEDYQRKRARGSIKGPIFPSSPEMIFKRTLRGMLSHRKGRGLSALKRVKFFKSTPSQYADSKKIKLPSQKGANFLTLGELSRIV